MDGELMAERQDLKLERQARSGGGLDSRDQRRQGGLHGHRPYRLDHLRGNQIASWSRSPKGARLLAGRVFREAHPSPPAAPAAHPQAGGRSGDHAGRHRQQGRGAAQ